jgi:hypothetical protein
MPRTPSLPGLGAILVQEPVAPPSSPQPLSHLAAAPCRGPEVPVPRARHGHAAALGSQDPRACVRTLAANTSRAAALLPGPRLALAQPRHASALASPCASTPATRPRRRGQVVGAFPRAPSGCSHSHTHTAAPRRPHAHAHTHLHTGSEPRHTGSREGRHVGPPYQRRRRSGVAGPRGEDGEATSPAHGGEEAGPRRIRAEPASRPASPPARAGLLSRRPS